MEQGDDLQQAEAHLKRAEADLETARTSERSAERELEEAVHEIHEAENHHPDSRHVAVEIATTSGFYPDGHAARVPIDQQVAEELVKAAKALQLTDTTGWIATVDKQTIDTSLSYEANHLKGCVVIDWGPPEGGGGA
jgi:chromosome segregation ATPase